MQQLPAAFGASWDFFMRDWCLNAALAYEPRDVGTALTALERLWPEEIAKLLSGSARGTSVVVPKVETGVMLAACEHVPSFSEVLHRAKSGERSAYSELVLVTELLRLGYDAAFAPPIDGRVLDAVCTVEGQRVFFEVVVPERSDANTSRMQALRLLSEHARKSLTRCRVEIEVLDAFSAADAPGVVARAQSAPQGAWLQVEDRARVRRIDAGHVLLPLFDDIDGMEVTIAGQHEVQGESASAVIRMETPDARAKRVFNEEYHQFSKTVPNVLVVNVCAVSGGMRDWPEHMSRLLQPTRNRRVGAIAFFDQGLLGPPEKIRRRWRLLVNPHAHVATPEALHAGLESLDESAWYGIAKLGRLTAAV